MNTKKSIFVFFVILIIAGVCNLGSMDLYLGINYDSREYVGDTTLYYRSGGEDFLEERSHYSTIDGAKSLFPFGTAGLKWEQVFIIPNREPGQEVAITSLGIYNKDTQVGKFTVNEITDLYMDADKSNTYRNGTVILAAASEEVPYPAMHLSSDFMDAVRQEVALYIAIMALTSLAEAIVALCIIKVFLFVIDKHRDSINAFIGKYIHPGNKGWVLFNAIGALAVLILMSLYSNYNIRVNYTSDTSQAQSIIYYNFSENYLSERFAIYSYIDGEMGDNRFSGIGSVKRLQLVPNNLPDRVSLISSIDVYRDNVHIGSFTGDSLYKDYILVKESDGELHDGYLQVANSQGRNSLILFNGDFLKEINSFNIFNLLRDIVLVALLLAVLNGLIYLYRLGKKRAATLREKRCFSGLYAAGGALTLVLGGLWWLVDSPLMLIPAIALLGAWVFCLGARGGIKGGKYPASAIAFVITGFMLLSVYLSPINGGAIYASDYLWFLCLFALTLISYIYIYESAPLKPKDRDKAHVNNASAFVIKVLIGVFVYVYIKNSFLYETSGVMYTIQSMLDAVLQMNIMWLVLAVIFLYLLAGKNFTNLLLGIVYFILVSGNIIKLKFHDTLLTPGDFYQIKDMFAIAPTIIGNGAFYGIIFLMVIALVVVLIKIKAVARLVRPRFVSLGALVLFVSLVGYTWQLYEGYFSDRNIMYKPYVDEITNERTNGVAFYNVLKVMHISDMYMQEPEGYSREVVESLRAEFDGLKVSISEDDVKPNVICILAESLIDLNEIEEISCSEDIMPTLHSMLRSSLISPRYGGYTAAVEYEALTGFSLAFYPTGVIPYTTYYNGREEFIPSTVSEFADNGYKTVAMHPNVANFYNRDRAYEMMGFDEYIDVSRFSGTQVTMNNFVRDTEITEKIIENIESSEEPVFLFGITMEEHYTSDKRYEDTEIDITSDKLTDDMLYSLEQQAQAYRHTDEMIEALKEYIDTCEEPTILYIFGDHLPPLKAFERLNYVNEGYNRYKTVLMGYSNYREISFPDMMTPNYLAAQMVIDSGIEHHSYFDYIYSLRDKYPIFHNEYIDKDSSEFNDYYMLQYDLMFGEQWLYGKD